MFQDGCHLLNINDLNWFFHYALRFIYMRIPKHKSDFQVPYSVFTRLCSEIGPDLESKSDACRESLPPSLKIAAFLMWAGGKVYSDVAGWLEIGTSTMTPI